MSVTEADTGSRPDGLQRRVVLLTESAGLTLVLGQLLGPGDRLSRLGSLRDLADRRALEGADLVVLDLSDGYRAVAVRHVRRRYKGPLAVLAGEAEHPDPSRLDDACMLLRRPFSIDQLRAALAMGAADGREPARAVRPGPRPAAARAAALAQAVMAGAAAMMARTAGRRPATLGRQAPDGRPDRIERAQRLLVAFIEGWRARRQIRLAGFWILVLLAFGAAFAAAQHGCGPACDALGTVISPAPTITVAGGRSATPSTASPKHGPPPTTTASVAPQGTGAYQGISRSNPAATPTTRRPATTTTRRPGSGGVAPAPPTTTPTTGRPTTTPTTAPPTTPTTAPPTTAPPAAP